jgi:hypothetical protein
VTCDKSVVFSTNKTNSHSITEILLKAAMYGTTIIYGDNNNNNYIVNSSLINEMINLLIAYTCNLLILLCYEKFEDTKGVILFFSRVPKVSFIFFSVLR